jgi:hypothetical protein
MAKFSDKMMGKEVGDARVYAEPHTMSGGKESGQIPKVPYGYEKAAKDVGLTDPVPNGVSYGMSGEPKTTGIKMRGAGAATKGVMSRGPMA